MSDSPTFTRTINIYVDSGQAQAAYDVLAAKHTTLNTKLDELQTKYKAAMDKAAVEGTKKAQDAAAKLGQQLELTKTQVDGNTAAMDRLSKKVSGELSASYRDLQATARNLNRELSTMSEQDAGFALKKEQAIAATKAVNDYNVSLGKTKAASSNGFAEIFKIATGVGVAGIAEKGAEIIKDGIKDSLDEAIKEEDIQSRLKNSLEGVGRLDLFKPLNDQAEELGKKFKFVLPDDIKDSQDRLVTFGKLSADQINQLLPVIINFAAKTRQSLPDATDAMLKAFSGMESMDKPFHKLGVELDKNGSFAANFSAIMGSLAPKVAGAGEALERTAKGSREEFSVMITEAKKWAGEAILPVFVTLMNVVKSIVGPSESLTDSFKKQNEEVKNLTTNVEPLLSRYDELKGKTNLTKTEQDELRSIIDKVGNAIPGAITQFDKYGNALDINTQKAKDYIKQQQAILGVKNKDAIDDRVSELKRVNNTIAEIVTQLNQGYQIIYNPRTDTNINVPLVDDEIKQKQAQLKQLQDQKLGLEGILKELKGETEEKKPDAKALDGNYKKFDLTKITGIQEKLQSLQDELKSTTIGSDAFKQLQKEIKETTRLLDQAMGKTKDTGDEWKKFLQKVSDLRQEIESKSRTADSLELVKLKEKFADLDQESKGYYDKGITSLGQYNKTRIELSKLYAEQLKIVEDKQFGNRSENELTATQGATGKYYDQQKDELNRVYAQQLIGKDQYDKQVEILDTASKHQLLQNFMDYYDVLKVAYKDDVVKTEQLELNKLKLQNDVYNQDTDNYIKALARKNAATNAQDSADVTNTGQGADALAKRDARLKQLQDELAQKLALIQGNEEAINQAMAEAAAQRQAIEKQTYDEISGDIKKYGDDAIKIISGIEQISENISNAKLAKDKATNNAQEANLKDQLDHKQISQVQYNSAMAAIKKKELDEENKIAKKEFAIQKGLKLTQAVINTAAGVTQALGSSPPPLSYVEAAISGALGAVEIGVIASEKFEPKYAEGTDSILNGPSHASGGINMVHSGTGKKIGELEGNEAVISAATTLANKPLIHSLLRANGKPVINSTRAIENSRAANNGFTHQTASGSTEVHHHESNSTAKLDEVIGHLKTLNTTTKQAQHKKVIFDKQDSDRFAANTSITYKTGL